MSTLKAVFHDTDADRLLGSLYPDVGGITVLTGGEASRAFSFTTGEQRLVLRVNHHFSYQRDAWASRLFAGSTVPAPPVVQVGQSGAHFWAVSERAPGATLAHLAPADLDPLIIELAQTLVAIHEAPIPPSIGYGRIDDSGNAAYASWREFLVGDGRYGSFVAWDAALTRASTYQRSLVERCWAAADALLPMCPEDRAFNHGDFSLDNVLADGRWITGVIDWSNCLYGDPVWDVAWADFWAPDWRFADRYFQLRPAPNGDGRLRCCKLMMAAESLGFYLHTNQPEKGEWLAGRIEALLRSSNS